MFSFGIDQETEYLDWLNGQSSRVRARTSTLARSRTRHYSFEPCPTLAVERYDRHTTFTKVCSTKYLATA